MNNSWGNEHWQQMPPPMMQQGMPHMQQAMQHIMPPPHANYGMPNPNEYGNMQMQPDYGNMGNMQPGNMGNMPQGNMGNMPLGNMNNMQPDYGNMPPDFGNMQGMQPQQMQGGGNIPVPPPPPLQPPNFLMSAINMLPPGQHGPGQHGPGQHGPGQHGPGQHGPGQHGPPGPQGLPGPNAKEQTMIGPVRPQDQGQDSQAQNQDGNTNGQGQADMVLDVDADGQDPDVQVTGATDGKEQKGKEDDKDGRGRRERDRGARGDRRDDRGRDRDRERERDRDRGQNRGSRRPSDRDRFDRNDRGDRNRDRSNRSRERRGSKWDNNEEEHTPKVLMPGMPGYGMPQPPAAMPNMPNPMLPGMNMLQNNMMGNMAPNMGNMPPNMGNMPPNMGNMGPNMPMMMNQIMPAPALIPNQPIYVTSAMILPPIPGTQLPNRREKPMGCRTIFVGGLPPGITEKAVRESFVRFGGITDVKLHQHGVCHVRFDKMDSVEMSFALAGYRFKRNDQMEAEATTLFIDYALNRDDYFEYERKRRQSGPTPPPVEHCTSIGLDEVEKKIKEDDKFVEVSYTVGVWLERGECNKQNAAAFYKLIQTCNNHVRRLYNEKMAADEEFQALKNSSKEKFANIVRQFEQVAKILNAAKVQRVWDHFTKQQRKNIEMWHKITEEVENIKEEFDSMFNEDEVDVSGRTLAVTEKFEALRAENENLMYELEGYKNEAHLAKDEAERKFEKFKAQFIAQQALQNKGIPFTPPLPSSPSQHYPPPPQGKVFKPQPPPPTPDDKKVIISGPPVPPTEAKLISLLTVFLMVHPLGASLDYLVSYVRSMVPSVTQASVHQVLQKYNDVFRCQSSGVGANIEHRWGFVTFDLIKREA